MTETPNSSQQERHGASATYRILDERYEVQDLAGQGAMGSVYRGYDKRLRRPVALKCLLNTALPQARESAIREARTLASLRHASLVHIYDVLEVSDQVWIVTEWLNGKTLDEVKGPLLAPLVTAIFCQVYDALSCAHEQRIFHRDVKPSNIMLCEDGRVVLIDFGVAFSPGQSSGETMAGSLRYVSPSVLEGKTADVSTDLFSTALVLLEVLSGQTILPDLAPLPLFRYLKDELEARVDDVCDGLYPPLVALATKHIERTEGETARDAAVFLLEELKMYTNALPSQLLMDWQKRRSVVERLLQDQVGSRTKRALTSSDTRSKEKARWIAFETSSQLSEQSASRVEDYVPSPTKTRLRTFLVSGTIGLIALIAFGYARRAKEKSVIEESSAPAIAVVASVAPSLVPTIVAVPTQQDLVPTPIPTIAVATPVQKLTPPQKLVDKVKPVNLKVASNQNKVTAEIKERMVAPAAPVTKHKFSQVYIAANAWAELSIDGREEGKLPRAQPFPLSPGTHRIRLQNPYVEPIETEVIVPDVATHRLVFRLEPRRGNHLLMLQRSARLFVDDEDHGTLTSKWVRLTYGSHQIRIEREGEEPQTKFIDVGPDSPSQLFLD